MDILYIFQMLMFRILYPLSPKRKYIESPQPFSLCKDVGTAIPVIPVIL